MSKKNRKCSLRGGKKSRRNCAKFSAQGDKKKNLKEKPEARWDKGCGNLRPRPHPAKIPIYRKELKKSLSRKGNHQQQSQCKGSRELGSQVPDPTSSSTWQLWPHGSGFRVKKKKKRKGIWQSFSMTKESCWGHKYMSGMSLNGWPGKPLCEAVKVEPGFPWSPQDVDVRAVGYLL